MRSYYFLILILLLTAGGLKSQDIANLTGFQGSREETCSGSMRQLLAGGMGRVADIDNDGFAEIVNVSTISRYEFNAVYWYATQYNTAAQSYEIEYMSDLTEGVRITHLSVMDLDGDGSIEVIMEYEGKGIQVIDGATKEKKYSFTVQYPMYSSNRNIQRILKADADNDGITEIVLVSGDHCWLFLPSSSGMTLKSDFPYGGNDARFGNVDDNPDGELVFVDKVVRINGDNAELLWTIPDSWGYSRTELIDIDADGKKEILNNQWHLTAWNGDTHDTIYTVYLGSLNNIFIYDVDGDGQEEILHDANYKINCVNSSTGEVMWEFANPGEKAVNAGIADLDNDGAKEIFWSGTANFSGSVIYIYDFTTQTQEWKSTDTDGPFSRVRVADIDNDNEPELITVSAESESGYGDPVMSVFDAVTNTLEWQSSTEYFKYADEMYDFRVTDIDNDDTTEIVAIGLRGRFYIINGITKRLEKNKGFMDVDFIYTLNIEDVDNDGQVELVTSESGNMIVIDPSTWTLEWKSADYGNYGDYVYRSDVGNIDSDAAPEIIFQHSNVITVFDGITHAATDIPRDDISSFTLFDKNNDGISEIFIGTLDGRVGMITVDSVEWTSIKTGKRINDLHIQDLLAAAGEEFVFISNGRLRVATANGKFQETGLISVPDSQYDCIEIVDYNRDGKMEILAGTSFMVTEMDHDCYKCAAIDVTLQVSHLTCGHGNDGSVTSLVNNATAPVNYVWNNGMASQNITGLAPGIYTLLATDAQGCEDTDSIEINQQYLQAYIHATRQGCTSQFPGEITTEIVNGVAPYTYVWNNGETTPGLYNPPAGEYTVLITDAINCTRQLTAPMIKDSLIITSRVLAANCHDGGSIEIQASGRPPYTYVWSNGYDQPFMDEPEPGTYTITVNDQHGCSASKEITFEQLTELGVNVRAIGDNPETPEPDGAVVLEPFGGAPPYTIDWGIEPEPEDPFNVIGLKPDEYYSFQITDAAGCYLYDVVEITNASVERTAKLYPNPARDFVYIDLTENLIPYLKVTADFYSFHGRKEMSISLTQPVTEVNLSHLGSGAYIVKINIDGIDTILKLERAKHKKKE